MPSRKAPNVLFVLFALISSLTVFSFISAQPNQPDQPVSLPVDPGMAGFQPRADFELLTNGGFEFDSDGDKIPDGWKGKKTQLPKSDKFKCNKPSKIVANSGSCAFMFKGNPDGTGSKLQQTLSDTSSIVDGTTLMLSAYVDPKNGVVGSRIANLVIKLSDGSKIKLDIRLPAKTGSGYMPVNRTQLIVIPDGLTITNVKFAVNYGEASGKFLIDDVSLKLVTIDPTSTWTATPSATLTASATETEPALTFTPSNTATITLTYTPTDTPTDTATPTLTYTPTSTPTDTPTITPTFTPTNTPTQTPIPGQITVNSIADAGDMTGGAGHCDDGYGNCTLRAAIQTANYNSEENIIIFNITGAGPYSINLNTALPSPLPTGGKLTIDGGEPDRIIINGKNNIRALSLTNLGSTPIVLRNLTFTNFSSTLSGGVIYSEATVLTIDQTQFFNNKGGDGGVLRIMGGTNQTTIRDSYFLLNSGSHGAAISMDAPGHILNILNTVFDGNSVTNAGGSIFAHGGQFIIVSSLFHANMATTAGGGIYINTNVNFRLINSTVSSNIVTNGHGGGVAANTTTFLSNSTIADNTASGSGDGVHGNATLANTIVANNSNLNCSGTLTNNGGNLQYPGMTCGTGIASADPLLQPLDNNGTDDERGTLTHALGAGSPAINAGIFSQIPSDMFDMDGDGNLLDKLPYDQRGSGYNRIVGGTVDIGAFEVQ